jgi:hypothetical protein
LQTVCEALGHPLPVSLADQAVANSNCLAHLPVPVLPQGGALDRPATREQWVAEKQALSQKIENSYKKWRRNLTIDWGLSGVCFLSLLLSALMFLIWACHSGSAQPQPTPANVLHTIKVFLLTFTGTALLSGFLRWKWWGKRREQEGSLEIEVLERQRYGLDELSLSDRPSISQIKEWCSAPGISAACHQIWASGVPLLKRDAAELRRRYKQHLADQVRPKEAQQEAARLAKQEQEAAIWNQDFRRLIFSQLTANTAPSA